MSEKVNGLAGPVAVFITPLVIITKIKAKAAAAPRGPWAGYASRPRFTAHVSFGTMDSAASPLLVFRAVAGWRRRGFRFGCRLLVGLVLTGCAGRIPQSADRPRYKHRILSVSGHVLDAVSRQPLAGILIEKNGAQTISAADGSLQLKYPKAKKSKYYSYADKDELAVDFHGYARRAYIPANASQPIELLLVHNSYQFPPVGKLHPADSVYVSPHSLTQDGLPGSQWAVLIQDSTIHQPRKLRAVSLRIGRNGFPYAPCRIRLYRYNGPSQPPGEDLLTDNCTIAPESEGVFSFDLNNYDVVLPTGGFFLALEFIVGANKFYPLSHIVSYVPVGPLLRPPYAFADTRTWDYIIGKGWQRVPAAQTCWPRYESSVSVEVEPAR